MTNEPPYELANAPAGPGSGLRRERILGVDVVAEPFEAVVDGVVDVLRDERVRGAYLCPTGVHGVIEARRSESFREILNGATFNVADGMPLVVTARLLGAPTPERAFGPDVMLEVIRRAVPHGIRHFLYGGKPGVADALRTELEGRMEGVRIVGTFCPPFRPLTAEEEEVVIREIRDSGADAVWVGLSTPKQERWIATMRSRLNVRMLFSVGAAFDYHTGAIRQAPAWMKRSSLEWLYRLIQEPGRLWRRYLDIVPTYLFLVSLQLLRLRRYD